MLANEDELGARTSKHALAWSIATLLLMVHPIVYGLVNTWLFLPPVLLLNLWLCQRAVAFKTQPERASYFDPECAGLEVTVYRHKKGAGLFEPAPEF